MNEHAIYDIVGAKRQRYVAYQWIDFFVLIDSVLDLRYQDYENSGAPRSLIS